MKNLPRQVIHRPFGAIPVHLIYRLDGSLPMSVLRELKDKREQLFIEAERKLIPLPDELYEAKSRELLDEIGEDIEAFLEDALHHKSNGPYFLADSKLAKIVINSWHWIAKEHSLYIYAICVMSNHVHVLLKCALEKERIEPGPIMKAHKSFTATMCNRKLDRTGTAFWNKRYFDRDVREGTFNRVMWYVLNNPVNAGLVNNWRDWPGTWLNPDFRDLFG